MRALGLVFLAAFVSLRLQILGLVGSRDDILRAMDAAKWFPADPVTLRTSIEIVGSVVLDRPYHAAPVSPLYYQGKKEQLAFERPDGRSADRR